MVESHNHNGINSSFIGIEDIIAKGSDGAVLKWGENGAYWDNLFADETFQVIDYDLLQISDDANVSVTEATETVKKTYTFNDGSGNLTVKATHYGEGSNGVIYTGIFKNGTIIGDWEETNGSVSEVITRSTTVSVGDVFTVVSYKTGTIPNARVSNFRFYFLKTITPEEAI